MGPRLQQPGDRVVDRGDRTLEVPELVQLVVVDPRLRVRPAGVLGVVGMDAGGRAAPRRWH